MWQLKPDWVTDMLECISVLTPLFWYSESGLTRSAEWENLVPYWKQINSEGLNFSVHQWVLFPSSAFRFNILPLSGPLLFIAQDNGIERLHFNSLWLSCSALLRTENFNAPVCLSTAIHLPRLFHHFCNSLIHKRMRVRQIVLNRADGVFLYKVHISLLIGWKFELTVWFRDISWPESWYF